MGLMEASITAGMLIGLGTTSYLYQAVGYAYVFMICAGLMGLSVLYTFCIINDSQKNPTLNVRRNRVFLKYF